jgi:hypothetical protein
VACSERLNGRLPNRNHSMTGASGAPPQALEHCEAVAVAGDYLTVDQARAHREVVHGLDHQRIITPAGDQADAERGPAEP